MTIEQTVKDNHMIIMVALLGYIALFSYGQGVIADKTIPVWTIYLSIASIYGVFHILKKDLLLLQDRTNKMMAYYQNQKVEKQMSQPLKPQQQEPINPFDVDFKGLKQ